MPEALAKGDVNDATFYHNEAMEFADSAREARRLGRFDMAATNYEKAAGLEYRASRAVDHLVQPTTGRELRSSAKNLAHRASEMRAIIAANQEEP